MQCSKFVSSRPARLTCLAQKFMPSVGPFDAPVRWWFKISVRQRDKVWANGADLGDVVGRAGLDGVVEEYGGLVDVVAQIDRPHYFFGQPGTEDLVEGVAHVALNAVVAHG